MRRHQNVFKAGLFKGGGDSLQVSRQLLSKKCETGKHESSREVGLPLSIVLGNQFRAQLSARVYIYTHMHIENMCVSDYSVSDRSGGEGSCYSLDFQVLVRQGESMEEHQQPVTSHI